MNLRGGRRRRWFYTQVESPNLLFLFQRPFLLHSNPLSFFVLFQREQQEKKTNKQKKVNSHSVFHVIEQQQQEAAQHGNSIKQIFVVISRSFHISFFC